MHSHHGAVLALLFLSSAGCDAQAREQEAAGSAGAAAQPVTPARPRPPVDKVDILFVVDNASQRMRAEQAKLAKLAPALVRVLLHGERQACDPEPFPPVRDVHVGFVSSDMGTPGSNLETCAADGGDDGRLRHAPPPGGELRCKASYPAYLSHEAGQSEQQLAEDLACMTQLGTGGCRYPQQLEAGFKALWPTTYFNKRGEPVAPNPYRFISTSLEGSYGRGDVATDQGGSSGFLRMDAADPSLLLIVLISDQDDCSNIRPDMFLPDADLPNDSPYRGQDPGLRCYLNRPNLYDVNARYVAALRELLRPGREDLVAFAAIVGVPSDLVDAASVQRTDFGDAQARTRFYSHVLEDPRLAEVPDERAGSGEGRLRPACSRTVAGADEPAPAYPPRRIIEVARDFGEQGLIQSLCQDDLDPVVSQIANLVARSL